MKRSLRGHALTSLAMLAAGVGGYLVGIHDSARSEITAIAPSQRTFVKRVVGNPGDRIEVRKGLVLVNGIALREPEKTGK